MCGIFAIIFDTTQHDDIAIQATISSIKSMLMQRGPDQLATKCITIGIYQIVLVFSRLAIMDVSTNGLQPFSTQDDQLHVICNGELYNTNQLKQACSSVQYDYTSTSDCQVLIPHYINIRDTYANVSSIDPSNIITPISGEFAAVYVDVTNKSIIAFRDRYGIRPLFMGKHRNNSIIAFASEMKLLVPFELDMIEAVVPNRYHHITLHDSLTIMRQNWFDYDTLIANATLATSNTSTSVIMQSIRSSLTKSVQDRLSSDRNIGFLLSGGLDSSLIVSIACKLLGPQNITCYSIGTSNSPDGIAAKRVTSHLNITNHHIIDFDYDMAFDLIPSVIQAIESYDITTVRASVPQYMIAAYIANVTPTIKVLLSGEGSDEIHGGYKYFANAPSSKEFQLETLRLLKWLYCFDNLRTDRTMAHHGLEVRVPFLDNAYVELVYSIDPNLQYKQPIEKQIIRDAFVGYLPDDILYRAKDAFSDAVSNDHECWYAYIQRRLIGNGIGDAVTRVTKEASYYLECFDKCGYDRKVIPFYWMPKYQSESVVDPSARTIGN